MRFKEELDNTDDSRNYKKARKRYLAGKAEISCVYCPYHRVENAHKYQRSWKKLRKTQHK